MIWYSKRVIDNKIVCLVTYEQQPVFTEEERHEWQEINEEEYLSSLKELENLAKKEYEEFLLKNQDLEITIDD